ncbi:MAG: MopE-related protein [Pseudomonadota bacterium]
MRLPSPLALILALSGCDLVPEGYLDPDGDGYAWPEDCDGAHADVHPGAADAWYDGLDQDCGGEDDYDQDGDGWVPAEYAGLPTAGVPGSGALPGGDCWDDPTTLPQDFEVVSPALMDAAGQPLAWVQPAAAEVHPQAADTWYDGVDQDCDGADDLDQDGDGWATTAYPDRQGVFGEDCIDGAPLDDDNPAGTDDDEVHPDAEETWYDGTDQDCDDNDCDQDGDGYDGGDGTWCVAAECDDTDPNIFPTDEPELVWYDGIDDNCDGNDGDQDGDGFWADDYRERVAASGSGQAPLPVPSGAEGDCWDVPLAVEPAPEGYTALAGFTQPAPEEVHPDAVDAWYDGVDQDCAGDGDFDQDADGYDTDAWPDREGALGDDCDDLAPEVHPGQVEGYYDGVDDSCTGRDGDADGDGWWVEGYEALVAAAGGVPLPVPATCGGDGATACVGDCDDTDAAIHPDRLEDCATSADDDCDGDADFDDDPGDAIGCTVYYLDADADGHGTTPGDCTCAPSGAWSALTGGDCDDADPATWPGAEEHCDGHDDDCDGLIDEDDAVDPHSWYADGDGDGYGDPASSVTACAQPTGHVTDATDCDDSAADVHPGATEWCDGIDHDCDGLVNEDDAGDAITYWDDTDGDGCGDPATAATACTPPAGSSLDATDCDDADASIHPGAEEWCDGLDHDCDGLVNEDDSADAPTWYADADGDGYGDAAVPRQACSLPSGHSADDTDCDDARALSHPGATEYCNGVDDDCDGTTDEPDAVDALTWYLDDDGEGYGIATATTAACSLPSGYSALATDCDDAHADAHPGATEHCDGYDDDCDGLVDEADAADAPTWYIDYDRDGYGSPSYTARACSAPSGYVEPDTDCDDTDASVYPGAPEICGDGVNNDCDGGWFDDCGWLGDVDLSTADAILLGEASADNAGYSLATGGDFDGDGAPDLLVGAMDSDLGTYDSGAVYVVRGPAAASTTSLAGAVATFIGEDSRDYAGTSVAWAGDTDADGYDDALIGSQTSSAWLVLGPVTGDLDLSDADAELYGSSSYLVGYAVAGAGDTDADGYDDLLVGSQNSRAYLWEGPVSGSQSTSHADAYFYSWSTNDGTGEAIAGGADVDGDGHDDVLIGAPGVDATGTNAGAAYLVLGPMHGSVLLSSSADLGVYGESSYDAAGVSVALAGDVDGDGLPDLLVGATGDDDGGSGAGAAYVVAGTSTGSLSLASATMKLWGEAAGDAAGFSVAGVGDLDIDGLDDLLIGAPSHDGGATDAGAAYLVLTGADGSTALSSATATFLGGVTEDYAGYCVIGGGDLDLDGLPELLVAAPWQDSAASNAGAIYLFEVSGI